MIFFLLILACGPLALALAYAMARIAIRLRQAPGLAALSGILICWQTIALSVGQARLASSVTLLFTGVILIAFIQWLRANRRLLGAAGWGGYGLGSLMAAIAAAFPGLTSGQALAFALTFGFSCIGVWAAARRARTPAPPGWLGAPPVLLLGLWLMARIAGSFPG